MTKDESTKEKAKQVQEKHKTSLPILDVKHSKQERSQQLLDSSRRDHCHKIIEQFIASENTRELHLARCMSREKQTLLEAEFHQQRKHESALLERVMRETKVGSKSYDVWDAEVQLLLKSNAQRIYIIESTNLIASPHKPSKHLKKQKAKAATRSTKSNTAQTRHLQTPILSERPVVVDQKHQSLEAFFVSNVTLLQDRLGQEREVKIDVAGFEVIVRRKDRKYDIENNSPMGTEGKSNEELSDRPSTTIKGSRATVTMKHEKSDRVHILAESKLQQEEIGEGQAVSKDEHAVVLQRTQEKETTEAMGSTHEEYDHDDDADDDEKKDDENDKIDDRKTSTNENAVQMMNDGNHADAITALEKINQVFVPENAALPSTHAMTEKDDDHDVACGDLDSNIKTTIIVHDKMTQEKETMISMHDHDNENDDDDAQDDNPLLSEFIELQHTTPQTQIFPSETTDGTTNSIVKEEEVEHTLEDKVEVVQRIYRGHLGRKSFQSTLYKEAKASGVLGAMPGTSQGSTGWYQDIETNDAHYFIVSPSGEWQHKVKQGCPKPILTLFEMKQYVHDLDTNIEITPSRSIAADHSEA